MTLVAIFCNSFPPEGGGAAARIYNLAALLRNAGYQVQVVCAMPNYPTGKIFPAYRRKLVTNEIMDGIAVRRVWIFPSNSASAIARGWSIASFVLSLRLLALQKVWEMQPALVIVSSPPLPMASVVVQYFKKRGARVLLNVSDIWPLSASALGAMKRSALYKQLEARARRMYLSADAITAQSSETQAHILKEIGNGKPMMLYRNLPLPQKIISRPVSSYTTRVRIIYPGLVGHAQGLLALCRAIDFAMLGAELHIYGEGAESGELAAFISAHPERGITLHQPVSTIELTHLLGKADALLIPLVAPIEGALPSKLFTAVQAGLPVLYSGGGEGEQLVKEYGLGWTAVPGDYAKIANQISGLVATDAEEIQKMRTDILANAAAHFSKPEQDAAFLKFLRGIIA